MNKIYDLIIIGAGPSGLSAAIYAGRANLKTLVIDKSKNYGGQIHITSEVVNYPGIISTTGPELGETMMKQAQNFGVEFLTAEVIDVNFTGDIKHLTLSDNTVLESVGIIISTGAKPRTLGFKGETEFAGRGIGYCATCDGEFFKGLDVFVIGAGFAAAEEAIFLTRYASKVTVIAREPEFTCSKTIADKVLRNPKIEVKFNSEILSVEGTTVIKSAKFIDNITNQTWEHNVSDPNSTFGVFVFVGYEPINSLFKGKIKLDDYGYILTDENLQTDINGVFAAGDIRPKRLRQLVTAVSDGAVASTEIEKYIDTKKEELGLKVEKEEPKSFLDDDIKSQLKPVLERFESDVIINTILDNGEKDNEIISFLTDFSKLSDKIKVNIYNKNDNNDLDFEPSIYPIMAIMDKDNKFTGVSYHSIPGGHEFNSFIISLYNVAGPGQTVDSGLVDRIKEISNKINMKVCVSLSCTMCPDVVVASQFMATKNDMIEAEMLDLSDFMDIKNKFNIMSVPAVIINDEKIIFGKKSLEELITIAENL